MTNVLLNNDKSMKMETNFLNPFKEIYDSLPYNFGFQKHLSQVYPKITYAMITNLISKGRGTEETKKAFLEHAKFWQSKQASKVDTDQQIKNFLSEIQKEQPHA